MLLNSRVSGNIHRGSMCFWSWNDSLDREEIRCQLEDFSKGKFSGVVIHARAGLRTPYMSDEWMDYFEYAVQQAERLGVDVWIYDEDGWPSGFAGGKVNSLGEEYQSKVLVFGETLRAGAKLIAAYRKSDGGYTRLPNEEVLSADLVCGCKFIPNYVDLMSEKVVAKFIETTHEVYKRKMGRYFGTVIKGVFTDEPQLTAMPYSPVLEDIWRQRYGTELRDELYMLYVACGDYRRFRQRYRSLVNEQFSKAFTGQVSNWCEENGLLFTGHFAYEDGLSDQMRASCGVMRQYADMSMPGIDHLGNRYTSPILCKQVSSVAHQLGRPEVLSETFGCAGWQVSFDRLRWIWGRQNVLGITKPCFHLAAYSMTGRRKRDYPAFFSYQEPWWDQFPDLMTWMDGLCSLMKEGDGLVDWLVLSSIDSVRSLYPSDKANAYSAEYRRLVENLLDIQLDCELGDEYLLAELGKMVDGRLQVGCASYRNVVVPPCESLSDTASVLLQAVSAAGGHIWYIGEKPAGKDLPYGHVVCNRRDSLQKAALKCRVTRPTEIVGVACGNLAHNCILRNRRLSGGIRTQIWTNEDFSAGEYIVRMRREGADCTVCVVDPSTGAAQPLKTYGDEEWVWARLRLQACSNVLVETRAGVAEYPRNSVQESVLDVENVAVRLTDKNTLTIDWGVLAVDDGAYGAPEPVIRMIDKIYTLRNERANHEPMHVRVGYEFACDAGVDLSTLDAVLEDEHVDSITINGRTVSEKPTGWWADKKMRVYPIGAYITAGKNTIVLAYTIPGGKKALGDGVFESERNRFFFPVEPESIYIRGDFDLVTDGSVVDRCLAYSITGGSFRIAPPTGRRLGDITAQNAWFYRGNAAYTMTVPFDPQAASAVAIKAINPQCACLTVSAGAEKKTVLTPGACVDITDMLVPGDNIVTVTLIGTNRNLLGPHHHIKATPAMVGPDTFEGVNGFEDFVSPDIDFPDTWTDDYSFIPFGCRGFKLKYSKPLGV